MSDVQPYEIYVETYGKVLSGYTLKDEDYGGVADYGQDPEPYDEKLKVSISLAVQDAKKGVMKSKPEFEKKLKEMLGE